MKFTTVCFYKPFFVSHFLEGKTMKALFKYVFIVLLGLISKVAFSQTRLNLTNTGNLSPEKKLSVIRDTYIEGQLCLSEEQKTKFRPLYHKYNSELTEVVKQKRQNQLNNNAKDRLQKDLNYSQRLLDIKKQYTDEFLKFLTADKVNKIFISEREFINEAISLLGEHNNEG